MIELTPQDGGNSETERRLVVRTDLSTATERITTTRAVPVFAISAVNLLPMAGAKNTQGSI